MAEARVYLRHLRAARFCVSGAKGWAERNNLNWKDLKTGVPVSVLRATGCALAEQICQIAEEEALRRGKQ